MKVLTKIEEQGCVHHIAVTGRNLLFLLSVLLSLSLSFVMSVSASYTSRNARALHPPTEGKAEWSALAIAAE